MQKRHLSKTSRFSVTIDVHPEPLLNAEWEEAEALLARLLAKAYLADHSELPAPPPTQPTR